MLELRKIANDLKIAIVVLHHLRKADSDDVFDTISRNARPDRAPDSILVSNMTAAATTPCTARDAT